MARENGNPFLCSEEECTAGKACALCEAEYLRD